MIKKEFRSMSVPSVDENYFDKIKIEMMMLMLCYVMCMLLLFFFCCFQRGNYLSLNYYINHSESNVQKNK